MTASIAFIVVSLTLRLDTLQYFRLVVIHVYPSKSWIVASRTKDRGADLDGGAQQDDRRGLYHREQKGTGTTININVPLSGEARKLFRPVPIQARLPLKKLIKNFK